MPETGGRKVFRIGNFSKVPFNGFKKIFLLMKINNEN